MHENHAREQYFFTDDTCAALVGMLTPWPRVCLLCAPRLGEVMVAQGAQPAILDIDTRFAGVPGFQQWDCNRPQHLGQSFDLIFCDPPFFNLSLSRLFTAIRLLADFDLTTPLVLAYLSRRARAICGTFAPFGLQPVDWYPSYNTLVKHPRNHIQLFANVPLELPQVDADQP